MNRWKKRLRLTKLDLAVFLMTLIIAALYIFLDQTIVIIEVPKLEVPPTFF